MGLPRSRRAGSDLGLILQRLGDKRELWSTTRVTLLLCEALKDAASSAFAICDYCRGTGHWRLFSFKGMSRVA